MNVDAEPKDTMRANNVNDIDFRNVSNNNNNNNSINCNKGNSKIASSGQTDVADSNIIHSRAKRFLSFPVGSSFSTAVCLTTGVIGNPNYQYLSMGLNWGIAYDLPNTTWVLEHAKGFGLKDDNGVQIKRRHRRDLYGKLETLINGTKHPQNPYLEISTKEQNGEKEGEKKDLKNNLDVLESERSPKFLPTASQLYNEVDIGTLFQKPNDLLSTTMFALRGHNKVNGTAVMTTNVSSVLPSSSASLSEAAASTGASLQKRLLSRSKRYLSFPEGSSFSVAVCFTVGIIGNPRYNYMSFGLNWGVAYDLPNTTWILNNLHGFAKRPIPVAMWHRRSRRALYSEIEKFVDNMGYNGRDCILRALCESRLYFENTKMGMIGEMLRAVFSLPRQRVYKRETAEHPDITVYDKAYRRPRSTDSDDCSTQYDCRFSLLELAFGKYSKPPPGYYGQH
ncbi:uncharacterized protein [Musca autumnalis]|uniref:uncharacterized protein n=1 Tax=Musca autumnalis TaxID=221902 RepID=UPI003CFB729C